MKVSYRDGEFNYSTTAYLDEEPLSDGSYVGTNKHTNLPVHLLWSDKADTWVEVCQREFDLPNVYVGEYVEAGERPDCLCKTERDDAGKRYYL